LLTAVVSGAAASHSVSISYVDADGSQRRGLLDELWSVRFERASSVRAFGSFKGKRSFQGSWWFATTGEHVDFESWLERDNVMLLDSDPLVVGLSSQPFWMSWADGGKVRRHCPDYFARLADGSAVVVDVRPDERIRPEDARVFAATAGACAEVGWQYRRVGEVDPVLLANVRWLAGYRHRRCLNETHASRLRAILTVPVALAEAVDAVGDRLAVLPTLYHLMWSGVSADLGSAPLTAASALAAGASAA
jgi:hypothetical protein